MEDPPTELTHLGPDNRPGMVDVGEKAVTRRTATARAVVRLTPEIMAQLDGEGELRAAKGPVFQTAVLAGVMAAKKTSELIPLCHPLPLDTCKIVVAPDPAGGDRVWVTARAVATHRTGVEMEALTAATVAALTVYDMCKALSHDIVIEVVELLEKTGGKRDFKRGEPG